MTPMLFPVSMTFIAVCAGAVMILVGYVGLCRGRIGILRGDGGDPVLFKRIRIHGNFIETAPITAVVMLAGEMAGLGALWLWLAFASFVAGRVLHYVLYDDRRRAIALTLTIAPGLLMGLWLLGQIWL